MRWPIGLFALVALSGCPRIDTGEDGGTGPINAGPAGGLFIRAGYAIDIPQGALAADVQITVTIIDTGIPDVPERKRISLGYRFSPTSLTFKSPAKIYLPWVPDRVPMAVDQNTFDMRRQAGTDAYLSLPGAKTSMLGGVSFVEAPSERLGLFWDTSPAQPNVDRLEVTPNNGSITVGETEQLSAKVISPTGESVDATVAWSVVPPRVGHVDANGLFTSTGPGVASVTATAGTKTATVTVNVFGTAVGPVTYIHENPFPTGNDLWGGGLIPGGFGEVFAGANGTVLAHSVTGQWSRLFSTPGVIFKGIGGTTADNAVAIGAQGTTGVLVQFHGTTAAPSVSVYRSVEPRQLWFDGTHGMAVGVGNDVLIYREAKVVDGGTPSGARTWQTEYSPSFEPLLDVIGDGAGRFVTVGSRGSLYAWDPVRKLWDSLYQTQLATLLTAAVIATPNGSEAWAVGGKKLWHFQGAGWSAENFPEIEGLAEGTAMDLVDHHLLIGARLTPSKTVPSPGLIITYALAVPSTDDGGVDAGSPASPWYTFPTRNQQIPRGVFGGGVDSTVGYVVGELGAVYRWHHDTASFTEVSSGFYGDVRDVAALPTDVIASVNTCIDSACSKVLGRVMHRAPDGGFEELGNQGFSGPLYAVYANSPTDVLVSAETTSWHYDGAVWATVPVSPNGQFGPILDFKYCGPTLWGAGVGGSVFQGSSTQLRDVGTAAQADLYAVWCPAENEVWVAGDGVMASKISSAPWVPRTSSSINQAAWRAVWGPGGGEGFAMGVASYGIYWNTATLSTIEPLPIRPDVINMMWGSTIDNLYAVGLTTQPVKFGFALRFDGVNWHLVDSGSQRNVTAIDGISPTNIWLGTEGGGLLRAVPP